jgi:methyl-accepting chemotaxis protein
MYGESTAEGFSVVAKQIKNLAEQSREITTEIETVVEGMDFKAQKAIDHMRSVQKCRMEAASEMEKLRTDLSVMN